MIDRANLTEGFEAALDLVIDSDGDEMDVVLEMFQRLAYGRVTSGALEPIPAQIATNQIASAIIMVSSEASE